MADLEADKGVYARLQDFAELALPTLTRAAADQLELSAPGLAKSQHCSDAWHARAVHSGSGAARHLHCSIMF